MAAMTYLDLCKRVRQEAGIQGEGPTTVLDQVGMLKKVTDWVQRAWIDIQLMRGNWNFMWAEFTFNTNTTDRDYLAADVSITDLHLWDEQSFQIHDPAIGYTDQNELVFHTYAGWRAKYRRQMEARPVDRPQLLTILPDKKIRFEPKPDKIYTLEGDYKRSAQTFTANGDLPTGLPDDYHMIIVWQALKEYGYHKLAPEKLDQAETEFDSLLYRLEDEELPQMSEDYQALA